VFDLLHAPGRLILARAESRRAFEQTLQVKGTDTDTFAQLGKSHYLFSFVEQLPRPDHGSGLRRDFRGLAPQTGSISCPFGLLRIGEELHGIAARPPTRARWPTVNPGRANCEHELPVLPGVACHHLLPLRFGLHVANLPPPRRTRYPSLAVKTTFETELWSLDAPQATMVFAYSIDNR
jgi:hypothetical protein